MNGHLYSLNFSDDYRNVGPGIEFPNEHPVATSIPAMLFFGRLTRGTTRRVIK
jgi:hypothetical protein